MPKALRSNQMPSLQMRRTLRQAHEKLLQKSKENSTTTPEKIFEKNPKMISGKKKNPEISGILERNSRKIEEIL